MEKQNVKMYVDLMNKYDEQLALGITMIFNEDERNLMDYMRKMAIRNEELRDFLNKLTTMTPEERYAAVEMRYSVSEERSKENDEIIITLDTMKDYKEMINEKSKEEKNKLNYLINNYNNLNIKGIRLSDLKYIDENDEIKDIDLNDRIVPFLKEEKKEELSTLLRSNRKYEELEDVEENIKTEPLEVKQKIRKKSGFISAFLLFLLTGFAGGVLATLLTLFLSK